MGSRGGGAGAWPPVGTVRVISVLRTDTKLVILSPEGKNIDFRHPGDPVRLYGLCIALERPGRHELVERG